VSETHTRMLAEQEKNEQNHDNQALNFFFIKKNSGS
jgi:hypothetical protein